MAGTDPYTLLGVKRDSSQKEIQSAYRRMAKKLHPDLNPGDQVSGAQCGLRHPGRRGQTGTL
jgi:DnaJ-class molecular chaperone